MYIQTMNLHNVADVKVEQWEAISGYERVKITIRQQIGDVVTETILFAFGEANKELKLEV